MIRFATLEIPLPTPHGTYAPGLRVIRLIDLQLPRSKAKICLDPEGAHLNGNCHSATIPAAWINKPPTRRATY